MFKMLEMHAFGGKIRKIREELNFTRKRVEELAGVNKETLRKIEKGDVVPQFVTLQLLSVHYKVDLIELFNRYKDQNFIINTHNRVDEILLKHAGTTESLRDYLIRIDEHNQYNLLDPIEVKQFNTLVEYLPQTSYQDPYQRRQALDYLLDAIKLNHKNFSLEDLDQESLTYIEMRILFVCGVTYAELKEYQISNNILQLFR